MSEIGLHDSWVPLHLRRSALRDETAELDDVDVVTYVEHEAHVVIDQENGGTGVDDVSQARTKDL